MEILNTQENGDIFHTAMVFTGVAADLGDKDLLKRVVTEVVEFFELSVIESYWHHYQPIGLTGVYVLKQSSLTLHTWPEFNKLVIDVTTCGKRVDIDVISDRLKQRLLTQSVKVSKEIL